MLHHFEAIFLLPGEFALVIVQNFQFINYTAWGIAESSAEYFWHVNKLTLGTTEHAQNTWLQHHINIGTRSCAVIMPLRVQGVEVAHLTRSMNNTM